MANAQTDVVPPRHGHLLWWLALGAIGLSARLVVVVLYRSHPITGDSADYVHIIGLPMWGLDPANLSRAPVYPIFLGVISGLRGLMGGSLRVWIGVVQSCICVGASAIFGIAVGRRFKGTTGVVTFGLLMIWVNFVFMSAQILEEQLFIPLVMVAVASLLWMPVPAGRRLVAVGVIWGIACLTRSAGLFGFAALVSSLVLWGPGSWRSRIRSALVVLVAGLAAMAPWLVWTYHETGQPLLIDTTSGETLCMGNSPQADGQSWVAPCAKVRGGVPSWVENRRRLDEAWAWAIHHPRAEVRLVRARFAGVTCCDSSGLDYQVHASRVMGHWRTVNYRWWQLALLMAAVGMLLGWRRPELRMCFLLIAGFLLPILLSLGQDRYHTPWYPFLALAAAYAITYGPDRLRLVARHLRRATLRAESRSPDQTAAENASRNAAMASASYWRDDGTRRVNANDGWMWPARRRCVTATPAASSASA